MYFDERDKDKIVDTNKALQILHDKKVEVSPDDDRSPIEIGLELGFLTVKKYLEANDYVHGPYESYMLATHGIIVHQPNPTGSYTVYHVIEIEGTIDANE